MMERIDFDAEDAVTKIKLKDGTEIKAKFSIVSVSYDTATGKYHFELGPPVFQFVKNPGNLNLEVKK
jgi:hypothetical protein